jgi:hypothetical protein
MIATQTRMIEYCFSVRFASWANKPASRPDELQIFYFNANSFLLLRVTLFDCCAGLDSVPVYLISPRICCNGGVEESLSFAVALASCLERRIKFFI